MLSAANLTSIMSRCPKLRPKTISAIQNIQIKRQAAWIKDRTKQSKCKKYRLNKQQINKQVAHENEIKCFDRQIIQYKSKLNNCKIILNNYKHKCSKSSKTMAIRR